MLQRLGEHPPELGGVGGGQAQGDLVEDREEPPATAGRLELAPGGCQVPRLQQESGEDDVHRRVVREGTKTLGGGDRGGRLTRGGELLHQGRPQRVAVGQRQEEAVALLPALEIVEHLQPQVSDHRGAGDQQVELLEPVVGLAVPAPLDRLAHPFQQNPHVVTLLGDQAVKYPLTVLDPPLAPGQVVLEQEVEGERLGAAQVLLGVAEVDLGIGAGGGGEIVAGQLEVDPGVVGALVLGAGEHGVDPARVAANLGDGGGGEKGLGSHHVALETAFELGGRGGLLGAGDGRGYAGGPGRRQEQWGAGGGQQADPDPGQALAAHLHPQPVEAAGELDREPVGGGVDETAAAATTDLGPIQLQVEAALALQQQPAPRRRGDAEGPGGEVHPLRGHHLGGADPAVGPAELEPERLGSAAPGSAHGGEAAIVGYHPALEVEGGIRAERAAQLGLWEGSGRGRHPERALDSGQQGGDLGVGLRTRGGQDRIRLG